MKSTLYMIYCLSRNDRIFGQILKAKTNNNEIDLVNIQTNLNHE